MKRVILISSALLIAVLVLAGGWYYSKFAPISREKKAASVKTAMSRPLFRVLKNRGTEAKQFVKENRYNREVCFLVNMSLESGKNRFFIYDLKNDSVLQTGLVTHGRCNETWLSGRKYGNTVGCGCTSLGKYKVGTAYKGRFGLAYKLHGLDSTNSNAFKRYVVLHSHECVPNREVDPAPICQSDGCPTVSADFLKTLAEIIDGSPQPVLLWVFEG